MKDIGKIKDYEKEDLRFATPLNVAKRRAIDLKCETIVDLCSGIGIQANAFAEFCSWVYCFEIDKRKVQVSMNNFNSKNLKFEAGDVMSKKIIEKVGRINPDIIFCDTERLASEKERNLDSIKPDLRRLIDIYGKFCKNICIEVPPRIDLDKLKELERFGGKFEAEYVSLDNKLNRLNLRFGNLKECERSVIDVDSGIKLMNNDRVKDIKTSEKTLKYLFEASEALFKAGLEKEFADKTGCFILNGCEKNRLLFTSNEIIPKNLEIFCNTYIVIEIVDNIKDINHILKKNGFGKVLIKYAIDSKDYWKERNIFERGLKGDRGGVIFKINGKFVICEEV